MGILRGNRNTGRGAIVLEGREADEGLLGRFEAEAMQARMAPKDPYADWLRRREAEQSRERPPVRWVYRYPITAGSLRDRSGTSCRAASGRGPGDAEDGLVTVA